MQNDQPDSLNIPIEWEAPDNVVARLATNLVVQNAGELFILTFYETLPPVVVGTSDEVADKLKEMSSVKAKCVARIVIPTSAYQSFLQVMEENFKAAQNAQAKG